MPPINSLSTDENELFGKTLELYFRAKALIAFSEEIDPNSKINPQIWKELRDALDHFMRVFGDIIRDGSKRTQNPKYYHENLDKSHGHVYRAAFDALDGASISIRKQIVDWCGAYKQEILTEVVSGYWDKRLRLEQVNSTIADLRTKKDVACDESIGIIDSYVAILDELKNHRDFFLKSMPLLEECKKGKVLEEKRRKRKEFISKIIWIIISAIVSGAITTLCFTASQEQIKRSIPPTIQQRDSTNTRQKTQ
jgi:hypothetical protein